MTLQQVRKKRSPLYCSFCGKEQDEVGYLVAGPTVFICNECIETSREIGHEILTSKGTAISPVGSASAIAALYEPCEDAAGRVALDHAWAKFRGFTLPGPRDDDDLGRIVDSSERGKP